MTISNLLKDKVLHPFLIGAFPVLFLFQHNSSQLEVKEIVAPLLVVLLFSILIFVFLQAIVRNKQKTGLLTSTFLIGFFSYGQVYEVLGDILKNTLLINYVLPRYTLPLWSLGIVFLIFLILKAKGLVGFFNTALNVAAFFLVFVALTNIFLYEAQSNKVDNSKPSSKDLVQEDTKNRPNIYYIILDAYAGGKTLKEVYSFDNSEFLRFLEIEGFFIPERSTSNYTMTVLSLASSLNMKYLDEIATEAGYSSNDTSPLHQIIKNNNVIGELREEGYTYIHFSSGWGPTNYNEYADRNMQRFVVDNFTLMLIRTTMIGQLEFTRPILRERINYTFEKLKTISGDEPYFVFAHMLLPHPPWLFGTNGENVSGSQIALAGDTWQEKDSYINQLIYTNKQVKELVRKIIEKENGEAIIIIQADHGPSSTNRTDDEIHYLERFNILNAYYLPNLEERVLYDSITPVNTFRIILNEYFGRDYNLLEDKNYYNEIKNPYKHEEIEVKI